MLPKSQVICPCKEKARQLAGFLFLKAFGFLFYDRKKLYFKNQSLEGTNDTLR
jgi:hypothetical protein